MIIASIVSTDFLKQIRNIWNPNLIESATAKRIGKWCWEYFEKYDKAPGRDIEAIFYSYLKTGKLSKTIAEEFEDDILPSLSAEYENNEFNLQYAIEETEKYLAERHLSLHSQQIQALLANNDLLQADKLACEYKPLSSGTMIDLDLGSEVVLDKIDKAFNFDAQTLISFPGALGEFWNDQLVRGAFVSIMAPEKRGKTYQLVEFAMRACDQKRKVAFFQAGDMTEGQQLKRIGIRLAQRSNLQKYCTAHFEPVKDCIHNQTNTCDREERSCSFGIFEGKTGLEIRKDITIEELIKAAKDTDNVKYRPCHNCDEYKTHHWGTPWVKEIKETEPITAKEVKEKYTKFFINRSRQFKLSSHANDTLTVKQIRALLASWEKQDNFVPDVIIIDYADLLTTEEHLDERPKQNKVWKDLRRLSQEKGQPLVITATQADANSYEKSRLTLKNFSEDKRKYAHVTAMWGLNQDPSGREKKIGIMRINEIIKREGDFANANEVVVLQNLRRGRPFITSYW